MNGCDFCNGKTTIERTVELNSRSDMKVSVRQEEGFDVVKFRVQIGAMGYTMNIHPNFCFSCGKKFETEKAVTEE